MYRTPLLARLAFVASLPLFAPPAWGQTPSPPSADESAAVIARAETDERTLLAQAPPPGRPDVGPSAKMPGPPSFDRGPGVPGPMASPMMAAGAPAKGPHRGPPPNIAEHLSRLEVELGIRSAQLDAWRDFTDAMISVMQPPKPPRPEQVVQGSDAPKAARAPFEMVQQIADDTIERGRSAEALKRAIESLRTKLTPDQLQKLALIEARMVPPAPPGPPHSGFGDNGPPLPPPGR